MPSSLALRPPTAAAAAAAARRLGQLASHHHHHDNAPSTDHRRPFTMTTKTQEPVITSVEDLPTGEARWVALQRIHFTDQTGRARTWESAVRKTRSAAAGAVDAVAVGNILLAAGGSSSATPASTMLVIQYRPPLDSWTVEWPAGLVDAGETAEEAARREFREETGCDVTRVLSVSPPQAADPGLTNATMRLVMVEVEVPEGGLAPDSMPAQRLDDGEHIQRVVVPLAELHARLEEYARRERFVVAAKLFHFAAGMEFMKGQKYF